MVVSQDRVTSLDQRRAALDACTATAYLGRAARVTQQEWRRQVLPSCLGQAQEAVAQLRSRGIRASLEGGTWLVLDLRLETGADPDTIVADALDRVWPAWRVCVAE